MSKDVFISWHLKHLQIMRPLALVLSQVRVLGLEAKVIPSSSSMWMSIATEDTYSKYKKEITSYSHTTPGLVLYVERKDASLGDAILGALKG